MSNNIQRTKGRGSNYKFDRGGTPTEFGPYIGVVKNNIDPTRSGRLEVYIEQFGGSNPGDQTLWRTVSYVPPFYGVTPRNNATSSAGDGSYKGNQHSYGMWFTPPDVDVQVICFFVAGDPNQGYYIGCVPDPGVTHMIPAIGSSSNFKNQSAEQQKTTAAAGAKQLPVVEINSENPALYEDPRFWTQTKPVHTWVYTTLYNQGLLGDPVRGPITSSAQRESPSTVYGISTPGRPIYQGNITDDDIKEKLNNGTLNVQQLKIEGRRGGHSLVMDDGDLRGRDNIIRIRSSKGHQITMSDEADSFYIVHANGFTWIELGSEGTVDVFSTNSVNVRSQGEINLHADKSININAGENLNIRAGNIQIESNTGVTTINSAKDLTIASKTNVGIASSGGINFDSATGGWRTKSSLGFKASRIDLNGGASPQSVTAPPPITAFKLPDVALVPGEGWMVEADKLESIVTRAPTHEPYPYHNKGVPVQISITGSASTPLQPNVAKALSSTINIPIAIPSLPVGPTNSVQAVAYAQQLASGAQSASSQGAPFGVAAGITVAQVLKTPIASATIGSLSKTDVTGLLAQTKSAVGQASNIISVNKGIGEYGFTPAMLESAGFLKQGTLNTIQSATPPTVTAADIVLASQIGGGFTPSQAALGRQTNAFMANPTVWSGKQGVTGLNTLLNNQGLQGTVQQTLLSTGLKGLQTAGIITGREPAGQIAGLVQGAAVLGVGAVSKFINNTASASVAQAVGSVIKGASFATSFLGGGKMGSFSGFPRSSTPAQFTVNRTALDTNITSLINDPKVQSPSYTPRQRLPEPPSPIAQERDQFDRNADTALSFLNSTNTALATLAAQVSQLENQAVPGLTQINVVEANVLSAQRLYESRSALLAAPVESAVASTTDPDLLAYELEQLTAINRLQNLIENLFDSLLYQLKQLKSRAK